jgi:methionine-rich copper-binding protein CopC
LLVATTAVAVVVAGGAAPAAAHVELEASDPAAGAVLTAAPPSLSLTFSTTPITVGVDVVGPDGAPVAVSELARQGPTVVVPLPPLDQAGGYTVNWRAANDEHPFTGSYTISLDLPTTTTTEPSTTTTSRSEVAATDSLPTGSSGAASDDGGSSTGVALAVAGVLVLVALGAVVVAARVRRQRPSRATPATGPGELSPQ